MPDEDDPRHPRLPDSLTFSQAQVNHILGISLAQIYQTMLEAPLPEKLQALINELDKALAAKTAAPGPEDEDEEGPTGSGLRS